MWVSTSSGTDRTPRRRRHPSTAVGSGPVSTTIAMPAPAATTSASPWPTEQATNSQPGGGQPGDTARTGISTTAAPAVAASATRRPGRHRSADDSQGQPQHQHGRSRDPAGPRHRGRAGRARLACRPRRASAPAPRRATPAIARRRRTPATRRAASTPRTVAGATAGSASRLAGIETRLTDPLIAAMTGAVATVAAAGTASASATPGGTRRLRSQAAQPGASRISPAVASTDNAKPGSRASGGERKTSTSTAAPSAGNADRGRPDASASSAIAPITAARSTLGEGRASTTNPANATPAPTADVRGPTVNPRSSRRTAPVTMATFVPLTATRWDRPAVLKSAASWGSSPPTSPSTRPGSRPRGPSGSTAAASRRPARIRPAAVCTAEAASTRAGADRTDSTATVRSRRVGGISRPSTLTRWLGSRPPHPWAGASTSTRSDSDHVRPAVVTCRARAATTTLGGPAPPDERARIVAEHELHRHAGPPLGEHGQRRAIDAGHSGRGGQRGRPGAAEQQGGRGRPAPPAGQGEQRQQQRDGTRDRRRRWPAARAWPARSARRRARRRRAERPTARPRRRRARTSHTRTRSRSWASLASPMPGTSES